MENTEDHSDYSIGFFTYHYQDGREGVRYRLVTIGENGTLEPYLENGRFFIDEGAAKSDNIRRNRDFSRGSRSRTDRTTGKGAAVAGYGTRT